MSGTLREIIFDTETTGLKANDGDRVIEIGAVELINRFPTGKTYHVFVNPEGKEVHPDALAVHGISNDFLKDKPTFQEIAEDFLTFFDDGNLVAHNANFDMGFLNAELARLKKIPLDPTRVVDTLAIARQKFPGQKNSLDALCSRFGVDNSRREKHGALLDSEILAEVYIELLGGRQAKLVLEQNVVSNESFDSAMHREGSSGARQRQKPLKPRLSEEDIERHRKFVDTLGEKAIWKQLGL